MQKAVFLKNIPARKIMFIVCLVIGVGCLIYAATPREPVKKSAELEEISFIYNALKNPSTEIKIRALEIISENPNKFTPNRVRPLLRDRDINVRIKAAYALSSLNDKAGLDFLRSLAFTKITLRENPGPAERMRFFTNQNFRIRAILSIGRLKDVSSKAALEAATGDDDPRVVDAAWVSLARLGDKRGIEIFVSGLRSKERTARAKSANVLGDLGITDAIAAIRGRLNDWDKGVRISAIEALGKLKDLETVKKLEDTVKTEEDPAIKIAAINAIRFSEEKSFAPLLRAQLDDENGMVRLAAAEALAVMGDYSGRGFIVWSAEKAPEKEVRRIALRILALFPPTQEDIELLYELKNDPDGLIAIESSATLFKIAELRGK